MTDTRERARAYVRGEGCKCAPDHLTAFAESELELARFAPLGDNHHNAHKCPYCNPEREKELALARKQERLALEDIICSRIAGYNSDSRLHKIVKAAIHERNLAETGA